MIIDSPIISGSYAASGSLNQLGNVVISGSLTVTGSIIGTASFAETASYLSGYVSPFPFTGSAIISGSLDVTGSLKVTGSITSTGTLTAQTLVVQTVSSSVIYSSGSNVFGNSLANTQILTGSVSITGSLAVNGSNAVLTNQTSSMSASYAANATSASSAISSSFANTAGSLVTTSNYQMASLGVGTAPVAPFKGNFYGQVIVQNGINNATGQQSLIFAYPGITNNLTHSIWSGHDNSVANYNKLDFYISKTDGTTKNVLSLRSSQPVLIGSDTGLGLTVSGSTVISGSLTSTTGITGSLLGTSSFANNATSASYALTASFSLNVPVTSSYANNANSASYALSSSFATTASYLSGYVSPFPFTGSAIISGSLAVTGSVAVSNLSGSGVRYLVADESGSVTAQSASAALKSTQAFTSTAGQTTFAVTNGYSTGYVDVFINGSKLSTAEFTDTSGTNIVLATGSFSGDTVEVVKYTPALGVTNNVLRQLTTFTASAAQTVFSASYTPGLLDIFYNGSRLSPADYTANNGTYFTLATGSAANDILDVLVYSYQVGAFSGIGGVGTAGQVAYFGTTSSITGSPNFTISGSTMLITGSLTVSGSGTFTNIGPAVFSGSLTSTAGFTGSFSGTATSASYAATASFVANAQSASYVLNAISSSFATRAITASYADSLTVAGTLTAQTLVVQTITSSTVYSSGSNIFGNAIGNTQTFTGSVNITGSFRLLGSVTGPLYINSTGSGASAQLDVVHGNTQEGIAIKAITGSRYSPLIVRDHLGNTAFQFNEFGRLFATGSFMLGNSNAVEGTSVNAGTIAIFPSSSVSGGPLIQFSSNGRIRPGSTGDRLSIDGNALYLNETFAGNILMAVGGGNVGIGASPSYKLDVNGTIRSYGTSAITNMLIENTNASGYALYQSKVNGSIYTWQFGGWANGSFRIGQSGVGDFITISTGGDVGIGTSSPGCRLEIAGGYVALNDNALRWRYASDANHATVFTATYNGPIQYGYSGAALGYQGIGVIWTNSTNAYNYNNSTTWQQTSDIRIKQNLRPITGALSKICSLNPTHFEYKNKPGKTKTGFIAQEFEQVFEGHVIESEPLPEYQEYFAEGEKIKSIDADLIPYLVKALQEANAKITALQEKLERNNIN